MKHWKIGILSLACLSFSAPSMAQTYMTIPAARLNLFNGSVPSIDSFFSYYGSSVSLVLGMNDASGHSLPNDISWKNSGLPTPTPQGGGYAKVGNGECVDFVQKMSGVSVLASTWIQGDHVVEYWDPNALIGKPIATFIPPTGKYGAPTGSTYGHTGIILSAWKENGSNTVNAVWVVDQNFVPPFGGAVAKHELRVGGSGVNNLSNYYIIKY